MKRKSAWLSFAACALVAADPVKAAAKPAAPESARIQESADLSRVQVVTLQQGERVGFFDPATSTMYVYDSSLTKCVEVKRLKSLGEPAIQVPS